METIKTKSEYTIEVSNQLVFDRNLPVYIKIANALNPEYFGIWLSNEEAVAWANALLAAAGESEAASKIEVERDVKPQHTFKIGDYVQITDDIAGHIVDFRDTEAIVKGDMGQLVGAHIADIEFIWAESEATK